MKKRIFAVIAIIICFCICFSGCDFTFLSAEELIRPPRISGEISSLQKAFEKTVNKEFVQMKTPINGDDRSSYIILDIDRDGNDDGLVFIQIRLLMNLHVLQFLNMIITNGRMYLLL